MGISYHLYSGNSSGGPVDWTTPIATTASLTYLTAVLAANTQTRFGVRAFDTVSGLEEQSIDAQVLIQVDASQHDITALPSAPVLGIAVPTAAGGYRVEWAWPWGDDPIGFRVYLGTPTPNYATAVGTVAYYRSLRSYRFDGPASSLSNGTTYQIGVRAYNATGTESNTEVVSVTGDTSAPANLDALAATPVATLTI